MNAPPSFGDAIDYSNAGCVALGNRDYQTALYSYTECLKLRMADPIAYNVSIAVATSGLADALMGQGNLQAAEKICQETIDIRKKCGDPDIKFTYE